MPPSCDSGTALNPWPRFQWVFHRSVEGKKPQEAKHTTAGSRSGRRKKSQGSMNYRITASRSITLLLNLLTKEDPVWSRVSVSVKRWCTPFRAHKISTRYGCLFHMIASFRYRKYAKPSSTSVKKKKVVNQNQSSSKVSSGMPCLNDSWKGRMMESRMTKNMTKKSHIILPVQFGFKMPWLAESVLMPLQWKIPPSSNQCWRQFGHHWRNRVPAPTFLLQGHAISTPVV